jgi:hypothetical protein
MELVDEGFIVGEPVGDLNFCFATGTDLRCQEDA